MNMENMIKKSFYNKKTGELFILESVDNVSVSIYSPSEPNKSKIIALDFFKKHYVCTDKSIQNESVICG